MGRRFRKKTLRDPRTLRGGALPVLVRRGLQTFPLADGKGSATTGAHPRGAPPPIHRAARGARRRCARALARTSAGPTGPRIRKFSRSRRYIAPPVRADRQKARAPGARGGPGPEVPPRCGPPWRRASCFVLENLRFEPWRERKETTTRRWRGRAGLRSPRPTWTTPFRLPVHRAHASHRRGSRNFPAPPPGGRATPARRREGDHASTDPDRGSPAPARVVVCSAAPKVHRQDRADRALFFELGRNTILIGRRNVLQLLSAAPRARPTGDSLVEGGGRGAGRARGAWELGPRAPNWPAAAARLEPRAGADRFRRGRKSAAELDGTQGARMAGWGSTSGPAPRPEAYSREVEGGRERVLERPRWARSEIGARSPRARAPLAEAVAAGRRASRWVRRGANSAAPALAEFGSGRPRHAPLHRRGAPRWSLLEGKELPGLEGAGLTPEPPPVHQRQLEDVQDAGPRPRAYVEGPGASSSTPARRWTSGLCVP